MNSKNMGIVSVVGGAIGLVLSIFVTYSSFVTGGGAVLFGAVSIVMSKDEGEEDLPTLAVVGLALGVITLLVAAFATLTGQSPFQMIFGG